MWYPDWAPKVPGSGSPSSDDRAREFRLFEVVATTIESLIPRVEIAEPGLAYVPVAGAVRYYGGEEALVAKVGEAIPPGARLGLAEGPFAARCAAEKAREGRPLIVEDTAGFLADLEIESLQPAELAETFRWLGVTTLGALARLPRAAVVSRFGDRGLSAHRLATGEDRLPHPRPIPADLVVESKHETPLVQVDQVAFVTRSLAVEMITKLAGVAAYRVMVEVEAADGTVRQRMWRSSEPFTDQALTERVWWQVRAWIDTPGGVPGGVARIRLNPFDLSDEGRQLALLQQVGGSDGAWQEIDDSRHDAERALTRTQALVGPDAVLQAVRRGGRMPTDRVEWFPWGDRPPAPVAADEPPWPGHIPAPAPALVASAPPRLEVEWDDGIPVRVRLGTRWEPVLTWSGPWRMTGRWWRGEDPVDRYQIVTSVGAILCVVQDDGAYLAGVYD